MNSKEFTLIKMELRKMTEKFDTLADKVNNLTDGEPEKMPSKEYMNVCEVSKYLDVSEGTIYNWVNQGKIQFTKMNGRLLFSRTVINELFTKYRRKRR